MIKGIGKPTLGVQPRNQGEGVVGEEALVVQGVAHQLGGGHHAHGLLVGVLVDDILALDDLLQSGGVCLESGRCNHHLGRAATTSNESIQSSLPVPLCMIMNGSVKDTTLCLCTPDNLVGSRRGR